ncbi:hypothetical protein HHI36_010318 [Cryptolaemus montrouzieri]|uniref:Uncharacterized protein n=1 Tax=Cryptolaemus montrouzieri TaxID=559131 RepID=A0ABD2MIG8_9CUCU
MDKTGIFTTTNEPSKVLSTKEKKHVGIIASGERCPFTIVIGCFNAAGPFSPPFPIFGKIIQPRLLDGSPSCTEDAYAPNDDTSGEVFLDLMHFLLEYVRSSDDEKGHFSLG